MRENSISLTDRQRQTDRHTAAVIAVARERDAVDVSQDSQIRNSILKTLSPRVRVLTQGEPISPP